MAILTSIWKIKIPKSAILKVVEAIDEDQDGYISIGEIRNILKRYAKDVKSSYKYQSKKK